MRKPALTETIRRLLDFLGELGPRWGLPAEPCRVHGYLYLVARPVREAEMGEALKLDSATLREALSWLSEYRLVDHSPPDAWRTQSDPWELMMQALQERQRREIAPALELLRDCQRTATAETGANRTVGVQIGQLLSLAEDLAAINMQAQRLSPRALRQMVGFGGLAARFMGRALNGGER